MGKQRLSQRVLSLLLACVMLLTCAPAAFAESTEAALMRLMKTEGTVSVTNSKGRSVTVRDDMRLNSGYGLETEEASYAWINLDDAKLVKMDAVSEISIRKSGKKLDILLDSGNLFFNVSKPLEEEETFNIRTSTMAVGIRGTCGWVKVIDQWTSVLYVLEGTVTVTVTDPVTGETKTETVKGGETVTCKVYPQDTQGGKCDIIRQTFTVSDIDGFVLVELVKDNDLCNKIYEDSGLDIRNSGINAAEKLKEDQQEVHEKLKQIEEQGRGQENNVSQDPVWTDPEKDGTETSDNSDDCDSTTTAPAGPTETVYLLMPKTAAEVNETLNRANVRQVVLQPGPRARASTASLLDVDSAITVPSGKVLTLQSGVGLTAENGQLLAVQGTLTVGGDFRLAGDLAAGSQGVIRAIAFKLAASVTNWKVSSTTDSTGYYTLTYSPKGVYTVTFNANGGSVSPAQMKTGADGRLTSLPTPTRTGYRFDGWFTSASGGEQITTITVFTRDTTVYAHWTKESKIVITYDANGGTGSGTTSALIQVSPTLTTVKWDEIPVPTRAGYTFAGWYTEPTGGILLTTSYNVTASMTIYAHWTAASTGYTVTFDPNGGTVTPASAVTGADGRLASLPFPTRMGYIFAGWYIVSEDEPDIMPDHVYTADTTLHARWVEDTTGTYLITFNANGGTVTPTTATTGMDGKLASLPTPTRTGFTFNGWFTAATGGEQVTASTVFTRNTTVYAQWTAASTSGVTWELLGSTLYIRGNGTMESMEGYTTSGAGSGIIVYIWPWNSSVETITHVEIESGITDIGPWAFNGCTNLTNVTISGNITSIGYRAFQNCDALTNITIPGGVIDDVAFHSCDNLTNVVLSPGVTSIGQQTFLACSNLNSITIPASLTSIGVNAFIQCTSLTDVYFGGTRAQWNAVTIDTGNEPLLNATIHCTDDSEETGVTWRIENGTLYIEGNGPMESVEGYTTSSSWPWSENHDGIKSIVIANGVTTIGTKAFQVFSNVTDVTIPNSVTSIGNMAFQGCTSLPSVTIPGSVTVIGGNAFAGCSGMTSVTIPNSVVQIGSDAFAQCHSLTDVYYTGTEDQWSSITIGTNNAPLANATKHYNSSARSAVSYLAPSVYTDVPAGASYAEAVQYCKDNGLMDGTSATEFSPDGTLTRAMMVTVLHRLAGKPFAYATSTFADVAPNKWYSDAISWASGKGIVNGYNPTTFGVGDPVTHEQVGLIMQRYSGDQTIQVAGADSPKSPATRAEVAVTLMNYAKGRKPGTLSAASAIDTMCAPSGIAMDKDGSLFVTDVYGKQLWQVENRNGTAYAGGATVIDLYGQPMGGYNDASLQGSYFKEPWAIAPFLDGWAVSDTANNVVRLVSGSSVRTLNGATNEKLKVTNLGVAFNGPTGLAADDDGNLYVSDTGSGAVRRINPKGGVMTVAKNLSEPTGLCWKDGVLYIAETGKNRILKLTNGKTSTLAGNGIEGLTDGIGSESSFSAPQGVAVGDDGTVYVADTGNGAVRQIKGGTVTTLAVRDPEQLSGGLMSPVGLLARGNSLYICDTFARKIFVYQLG